MFCLLMHYTNHLWAVVVFRASQSNQNEINFSHTVFKSGVVNIIYNLNNIYSFIFASYFLKFDFRDSK